MPAPVPYSLDDAEGIVAASSEAVDALVVDAAFADDDVTELTDCAVSIGKAPVPDDAPPAADVSTLVVEVVTPDERPDAPVLRGAGVGAAALLVVAELAVALVSGAALATLEADVPEPPDEVADDEVPADDAPVADVPAALLPLVPALEVPAPAALALDDPVPPVAVVLADAPPNATWIGRFATEVGSKMSPRTSICVSRPG